MNYCCCFVLGIWLGATIIHTCCLNLLNQLANVRAQVYLSGNGGVMIKEEQTLDNIFFICKSKIFGLGSEWEKFKPSGRGLDCNADECGSNCKDDGISY